MLHSLPCLQNLASFHPSSPTRCLPSPGHCPHGHSIKNTECPAGAKTVALGIPPPYQLDKTPRSYCMNRGEKTQYRANLTGFLSSGNAKNLDSPFLGLWTGKRLPLKSKYEPLNFFLDGIGN